MLLIAAAWTPQLVGAQPAAVPATVPTPVSTGAATIPTAIPAPTIVPSAVPTLPPASASLQLPYPAVGTPAPGVTANAVNPNVPQTITLRQAILIGVAKSPTLASARGDLQLAKAGVDLARVPILPNLSGTATTAHSHTNAGGASGTNNGSGGVGFATTDVTSNSLSANLTQLIFDGGRTFAEIKSASASQVSFIDTYQRDLQTVSYNVAYAYYNALAAQRTTAVDYETMQQDIVQENLVIAEYHAGQASLVDIATVELPVAQARVALVQQQGVEAGAQAAFANAMGLDANTIVRPSDDGSGTYQQVIATAIGIPTYAKAISQAYLLRPDLSSAAQLVQAAQDSVRAAKLGYVPTLSGSSSLGTASTDAHGGTFTPSWSVAATLNVPIYDGGATHAAIEQAQGNLTKSLASYDTTKLGVQLNVKQTLTALISARAALDATQAAYNEAATLLSATQAQYKAGVTTLPLLLNAQVQLTTALVNEVNSIYSLRQAEQAFLYATGQNT
jgi:outer membrane protein